MPLLELVHQRGLKMAASPWVRFRRSIISLIGLLIVSSDADARHQGKMRDTTEITSIVIHSIGGPACISESVRFEDIAVRPDDTVFWRDFLFGTPEADAHFVIGRNGQVASVIPVEEVANHTVGINQQSIGIELVNKGDGVETFSEEQVVSLIELVRELRMKNPSIQLENIVRHSDIDKRTCQCAEKTYRRRQDPGANFPYERLLKEARLREDAIAASSMLPQLSGAASERECTFGSN